MKSLAIVVEQFKKSYHRKINFFSDLILKDGYSLHYLKN